MTKRTQKKSQNRIPCVVPYSSQEEYRRALIEQIRLLDESLAAAGVSPLPIAKGEQQ